jgi:hypothetical protein
VYFIFASARLAYIPGMVKKNTNPQSAADTAKIIAADAEELARLPRSLTGRDIINGIALGRCALRTSLG